MRFKAAIGILALMLFLACAGPTTAVTPSSVTPTAGTPPFVTSGLGMPELSPHIPSGWAAPIIFDQESLSFKIAWTNQGDAMAEEYSIVLLLDGIQVAEWYKPVIAPGSIKTQSVELKNIPDPARLMNSFHSLEMIVDPQNAVAESDEGNNSFSVQQYISFDLPDLEPHLPAKLGWDKPVVFGGADVVYGINPPPADGGFYMAYSVTNSGGGAAKSWGGLTQLAVNGLSVRQSYIEKVGNPEPQPGAFVISTVPIWKIALMEGPLIPGAIQIDWLIDGANTVLEVDEGNNSLSLSVDLPASRHRTTVDQPDEGENLIHLVYVLPADGIDEKWDINGTIESIAASMQLWLQKRSPVQGLRFDSKDGVLDITFVRLALTSSQIAQARTTSIPLMDGLVDAGLDDPAKIYAVWFHFSGSAGDLSSICGSQTAKDGVRFSFTYFERQDDPIPNRCVNQHTIMLHEVFHALDAVSPCAPNYLKQSLDLRKGHVIDDPNDLMYGGDELGVMIELDKDRDDYFGHGVAGCPDVADSPFLQPVN